MAEQNQYLRTMDRIHASDEAVDKAVRAALEADQKKQSEQKGKHPQLIRLFAAAAACAVIAGGVTVGVSMANRRQSDPRTGKSAFRNPFVLTVNAAELRNNATVDVLSVKGHDAGSRASWGAEETDSYAIWTENLTFAIACQGDSIDSVTYRIHNGVFAVAPEKKLLSEGTVRCQDYRFLTSGDTADTVLVTQEELDKLRSNPAEDQRVTDLGEQGVQVTASTLYTAYTVPYDEQNPLLKEENSRIVDAVLSGELVDTAVIVCLSTNDPGLDEQVKKMMVDKHRNEAEETEARAAYAEYLAGLGEPSAADNPMDYDTFKQRMFDSTVQNDRDKSYQVIYETMINDITIDVTANYDDGTAETRRIALTCEKAENGMVTIGAQLLD